MARLTSQEAAPVSEAGPHRTIQEARLNADGLGHLLKVCGQRVAFSLALLQALQERLEVAPGLDGVHQAFDLRFPRLELPLSSAASVARVFQL